MDMVAIHESGRGGAEEADRYEMGRRIHAQIQGNWQMRVSKKDDDMHP